MNSTTPIRTDAYIDGFNLYHSIKDRADNDPSQEHLKWLNLRALAEQFAPAPQFDMRSVYYFSAFATWLPKAYRRHQMYTSALAAVGVKCKMGAFKEKDRYCRDCGAEWKAHEEKESDVALAVTLVKNAYLDRYDRALVITADSDVVPAISAVRRQFPDKDIRVLTPPGLLRSNRLLAAAGDSRYCKSIKWFHIERSLFDSEIYNREGVLVARRPVEYDP